MFSARILSNFLFLEDIVGRPSKKEPFSSEPVVASLRYKERRMYSSTRGAKKILVAFQYTGKFFKQGGMVNARLQCNSMTSLKNRIRKV